MGWCHAGLSCLGRALSALILPTEEGDRIPYCSATHGTPWKAEKKLRAKADDMKKASMYVLDYTVVYIRLHN